MKRIWAILALLLLTIPALAQDVFRGDSRISNTSTIVANNTTAIIISANASTIYTVEAFNNATTLAYIKLYNAGSTATGAPALVTCGGSATPQWRGMIPFGTSSSGGGFGLPNINGDAYPFGITMCITTGIADSDTGAPAASTYIVNVHWKRFQP